VRQLHGRWCSLEKLRADEDEGERNSKGSE